MNKVGGHPFGSIPSGSGSDVEIQGLESPPRAAPTHDQAPLLYDAQPPLPELGSTTNLHKHLFGEEPARGRRRLRQSIIRWLPEILAGISSLACFASESSLPST